MTIGNPEYEWIDAAHADQMSYRAFRRMPVEYQEMLIAHYRTKAQTDAALAFKNRPKKKSGGRKPSRPARRGRRR